MFHMLEFSILGLILFAVWCMMFDGISGKEVVHPFGHSLSSSHDMDICLKSLPSFQEKEKDETLIRELDVLSDTFYDKLFSHFNDDEINELLKWSEDLGECITSSDRCVTTPEEKLKKLKFMNETTTSIYACELAHLPIAYNISQILESEDDLNDLPLSILHRKLSSQKKFSSSHRHHLRHLLAQELISLNKISLGLQLMIAFSGIAWSFVSATTHAITHYQTAEKIMWIFPNIFKPLFRHSAPSLLAAKLSGFAAPLFTFMTVAGVAYGVVTTLEALGGFKTFQKLFYYLGNEVSWIRNLREKIQKTSFYKYILSPIGGWTRDRFSEFISWNNEFFKRNPTTIPDLTLLSPPRKSLYLDILEKNSKKKSRLAFNEATSQKIPQHMQEHQVISIVHLSKKSKKRYEDNEFNHETVALDLNQKSTLTSIDTSNIEAQEKRKKKEMIDSILKNMEHTSKRYVPDE